jgi:hypothetical protein
MGRQLGWVWFGGRKPENEFLLIINANYARDDVFDVQFNGQSIGVADFTADDELTWVVYTWEDKNEATLIQEIVNGFVGDNVNGWPVPSARVIRDRVINGFYKVSPDVPFFDVNNLRMQAISNNFNNNFGWILPGVIINGISYVKYYEYGGSSLMDVTYSIEWPTVPS